MQERFIVAGLELVGADQQEAVGIFLDLLRNLPRWETVDVGFGHLIATELVLVREGDDRPARALTFLEIVADGVVVLHRSLDAVGDHHRPRLSADLALSQHLLVGVAHHDLGLETDSVLVPLDEAPQFLLCLVGVEFQSRPPLSWPACSSFLPVCSGPVYPG